MSRRLQLFAFAIPWFVLIANAGCGGGIKRPAEDTGPPIVTVDKPTVKPVSRYADFTGQIQAKETVKVRARVSGYINKVDFIDGKEVKEGDVLFEIDPVPYQADLDQAVASVKNYQAQLAQSRAEEARVRDLASKNAVSANELDVAVAKRGVNEAQLEGAKAAVTKAKQNLDWTKVTAPITGQVDRAYLTRGNVATGGAQQGTVLTTIVSVDPMYAYFNADEQSVLAYQRLVQEKKAESVLNGANIPIEAQLDGETGYPHHGVLDFVSNQLNTGTGSLTLRGTFPNPKRTLVPGLYVKAHVPIGKPAEAVLIPDAAVVTDQGSKLVYLVDEKNVVHAKPVVLGPLSDGLRIIESGLTGTERIIVRGMQRVQDGLTVDPQPIPQIKK